MESISLFPGIFEEWHFDGQGVGTHRIRCEYKETILLIKLIPYQPESEATVRLLYLLTIFEFNIS